MRSLVWALIALSAVGFVLAIIGSYTDGGLMGISAEGFSRTCTNLALLAIALMLATHKRSAGK